MSTRNNFLTFYIVLTDADQVKAYQDQFASTTAGGVTVSGVNRAIAAPPTAPTGGAVVEFNAPFQGYVQPPSATGNYIWTPNYKDGSADGKPFPIDVATFTRKSGGFLGIGGTTVHYYWIGQFVAGVTATAPANNSVPASSTDLTDVPPHWVAAPMPQRRFIDGFSERSVGTRANNSVKQGFAAGRCVGGRGFLGFRANEMINVSPLLFIGGSTFPGGSWERFYVRWSRAGVGTNAFWKAESSTSSGCFAKLQITPTGEVLLLNGDDNSGQINTIATIDTLTRNEWARYDILLEFNTSAVAGQVGRFTLYKNQKRVYTHDFPDDVTAGGAAGIGRRARFHGLTKIGNVDAAGSVLLAMEFANYVQADIPIGRDKGKDYLPGINGSGSGGSYAIGDYALGSDGHVYRAIKGMAGPVPGPRHPVLSGAAGGYMIDGSTGLPEKRADYWTRAEGLDWLNGTRIVRSYVKVMGAGNTFAGDFRLLNQRMADGVNVVGLTSSTSGAICEGSFDTDETVDPVKQSIGAVSALFGIRHKSAVSAGSGTLQHNINGAGLAGTATFTVLTTANNFQTMYRPSGLTAPADVSPTLLRYTKPANTNLDTLYSMFMEVELLGLFGSEDLNADNYPDGVPAVPRQDMLGQHNAPYPNTPWAQDSTVAAPAGAAFIVKTGTYVGNGTGIDLSFRAPVHMLWLRPTSGTRSGGAKWFSNLQGAHMDENQGIESFHIPNAKQDFTFAGAAGDDVQQESYLLRITGANQQSNALGVTYAYVAVMDPGARYVQSFNCAHDRSATGQDDTFALPNALFTPEWAWFWQETSTSDTTSGLGYKSAGHPAQSVGRVGSATVTASALAFGAGTLRALTAFHALSSGNTAENEAFSLWRRHDGNGDPGEAAVVTFGVYTGDGSASRSVIPGSAGKRPVFVAVMGENGNGAYRDPSHTTTDSELLSGGGTGGSTNITGGTLDGFSVGSSLNGNGVQFHYFVLWGSATAGNGGFSIDGEYIPVEAAPPIGPWPYPDPDPSDFDDTPEEPDVTPPADQPDLDTDTPLPNTDLFCVDYTLRLSNMALGSIGVTKKIVDLVADDTQQARVAREHIKQCVEEVLREFDWPFATAYADLTLVDGSDDDPANDDWTFAHRAPVDMIKARRVVNTVAGTKRAYDEDPPTFRLGSDSGGVLVYSETEEPNLEYTKRNICPAYFGDPLFKVALMWRLAAAFAPEMAKDEKKVQFAWAMYRNTLERAKVPAANESQPDDDGDAPWITGR